MNKELLIDWTLYEIYEDGRIYSKGYNKNKFIKGTINKCGYIATALKCVDGKKRWFYLHRVIWTYFNGAIPEGYQVNHIREFEKTNNALSNLNLMTPKENINYGTCIKRRAAKKRGIPRPDMIEQNKRLLSKPVVAVDNEGNVIYEFASTVEADRNGFAQCSVIRCCKGKQKTCGGYRWYYKEDYLRMIKGVA